MTGITFSPLYGDSLRNALQSGTLQAGKIQVVSTAEPVKTLKPGDEVVTGGVTDELKGRLEETYRQGEQALTDLTARYRANPDWATIDDTNNTVALPDVQSLSKSGVAHVQQGIEYLLDLGRLDGKTLTASNGSQTTDSLATYRSWLQARVGVDAYA